MRVVKSGWMKNVKPKKLRKKLHRIKPLKIYWQSRNATAQAALKMTENLARIEANPDRPRTYKNPKPASWTETMTAAKKELAIISAIGGILSQSIQALMAAAGPAAIH